MASYKTREKVIEYLRRRRAYGMFVDFRRQDLSGLDLSGLDLSDVVFNGADLSGADLRHANLDGVWLNLTTKLEGTKGLVAIPEIGSRGDTLFAWRKEVAPGRFKYIFATGCFEDDEVEFRQAIREKRREEGPDYASHAKAYRAAIKKMKKLLDAQYRAP